MQIGILKEKQDNRVAIVPDGLPKIKALGVELLVETSAGAGAMYDDDAYAAEARLLSREAVLEQADLLISINPPDEAELSRLKEGTVLISQFQPFLYPEVVSKLQSLKLVAISLDMIPRTTLAQTMDVLSSMASIAGYKAVLEAARLLPRYFPMFITAAGSVRPAKVLVIGAGVAGLQAIATARRLGAAVEAFDTRTAAKEEVLSLGAKFVEVEGARDDSAAGGYAVQQTEEFLQRQRAEVQSRASKSDVIITTAQVRGGKAPMLIAKETVEQMRKGSVIIDLAASSGGNCELTQNNETIVYHGVQIVGNSNLAALMPQDASFLYSNNVLNLLKILVKDGAVNLDMENEIIRGSCITK
ncbi:MAG: Re/Si-specific NAD(P)(+) transhydrogenase subunit alpha [Saprospiraceae bacterium]|nr:Re/Si-specific NAD(P)(+) transhydrogenase subunit alpha [Saprospiraceae bacterium]